jgi:hypothetical protein
MRKRGKMSKKKKNGRKEKGENEVKRVYTKGTKIKAKKSKTGVWREGWEKNIFREEGGVWFSALSWALISINKPKFNASFCTVELDI